MDAEAAGLDGPVGIQPAPGKRRKAPDDKRIALRVAGFAEEAPVSEGVVRLNPGVFRLERMRAAGLTKKRAKVRKRVGG